VAAFAPYIGIENWWLIRRVSSTCDTHSRPRSADEFRQSVSGDLQVQVRCAGDWLHAADLYSA